MAGVSKGKYLQTPTWLGWWELSSSTVQEELTRMGTPSPWPGHKCSTKVAASPPPPFWNQQVAPSCPHCSVFLWTGNKPLVQLWFGTQGQESELPNNSGHLPTWLSVLFPFPFPPPLTRDPMPSAHCTQFYWPFSWQCLPGSTAAAWLPGKPFPEAFNTAQSMLHERAPT